MEPAGKSGKTPPRFRRLFFRGVALLAAAPVLFLLLSNLWLVSPWGRGWLAAKISHRLGMETRLEGANWAPWSGIRLNGLTIQQPVSLREKVREPLFSSSSIRLWPVWKAWLHRRLELSSVEIETPRVVVPLQLLSQFSPPQARPAPPPAVAAADPSGRPHANPGSPSTAPPPSTIPQPEVSATPPVAVVPDSPLSDTSSDAGPSSEVPSPGTVPPTSWIHLRNGSFAFVSADTDSALFEAHGLNTELPLGGAAADSSFRLEALDLFGNRVASGFTLPLRWQSPFLAVGPAEQAVAGVTLRGSGKIALVTGLPVQIQLECPIQKDLAWDWPNQFGAKLGDLRGTARFGGLLNTPASWQGDLAIESQTVSVKRPDHLQAFDRGSAIAGIRGNVLSCPDFRLIGDNFSLLGNALAFTDGRGAAVLRLVAEPSLANAVTSRFATLGAPLTFSPVGTPDRMAVDLTLYSYPDGSTLLQLGTGGPFLDKQNTLGLIKALTGASP